MIVIKKESKEEFFLIENGYMMQRISKEKAGEIKNGNKE